EDRAVEQPAFFQPVERPEGHDPGQIAGDAEDDEQVCGFLMGHPVLQSMRGLSILGGSSSSAERWCGAGGVEEVRLRAAASTSTSPEMACPSVSVTVAGAGSTEAASAVRASMFGCLPNTRARSKTTSSAVSSAVATW